jgi:hypothetical protein
MHQASRDNHQRNRRLSATAAALALATSFACTPKRPTEIVAGVTTQIRVPDDLNTVAMVVQVGGEVVFCNQYPVFDGTARLPATLAVLGESGLDNRGSVTVKVVGLREDSEFCFTESPPQNTMVIRSRRVTFVDDQIKFLPLPLKESCADVRSCDEDNGETCVGGKCVSADVDGASLQTYSDALIFGNTNTCFDATNCMAKNATSAVLIEDAGDCTFRVPLPEGAKQTPANLNVRLYYKSLGSEILDLDQEADEDQQEGFAFVGKQNSATFRLAPNLCESNYQAEKILAIDASPLCPAKRPLQPICDDYKAPQVFVPIPAGSAGSGSGGDAGVSPPADEDEGVCAIAGLQTVESVVYVLMDRSLSMRKFFGDGGLSFAVDLPLSSPVSKRTKIGFGLLPPSAEQCGTNDYAPEIAIGSVEETRELIGMLLQDRERVLTEDPPQFFLEAALQAAYNTVAQVTPTGGEVFNRRAVVVITNRDSLAGSCPGPAATELAARALGSADAPIFTYAIALDSDEAPAPGSEGQVLESATELAEAGGTEVYNGVEDEQKGARAVNDILTELGTCLYEVKRPDDSTEPLPNSASIAYLNPNTPTKRAVSISYNQECSEASAAEGSGWNHEGGLVRLCGADCKALRKVIGDVSVFHAAQDGKALPAVPLVATAPCSELR